MTLNCKGNLIDLREPKIMGVLNLTPDSFYDGGKYTDSKTILKQVEKMIADGATFIDVGAYSSRPGAAHVPLSEELLRITPIIELILKEFPLALLSIDTFRAQVAKECIEAGAAMINDISAGNLDAGMMPTVAELQVPYIMMHLKGTPQTMQQQTEYEDLLNDILYYFSEKINQAHALGMKDIIVDPGFGFSKNLTQNYELMQKLDLFQITKKPVLVGISRKSMIYKVLKTDAQHALNGTSVLNTIALIKGAKILRVHDVKEAAECIEIVKHTQLLNPSF